MYGTLIAMSYRECEGQSPYGSVMIILIGALAPSGLNEDSRL